MNGATELDTLELIGTHRPAHGVRLLATPTNVAAIGDDAQAHSGTGLVLALDESKIIQLIGQPDEAKLGRGDLHYRRTLAPGTRITQRRLFVDEPNSRWLAEDSCRAGLPE